MSHRPFWQTKKTSICAKTANSEIPHLGTVATTPCCFFQRDLGSNLSEFLWNQWSPDKKDGQNKQTKSLTKSLHITNVTIIELRRISCLDFRMMNVCEVTKIGSNEAKVFENVTPPASHSKPKIKIHPTNNFTLTVLVHSTALQSRKRRTSFVAAALAACAFCWW